MFDLPKYGDGVCLARLAALLDALSVDRARLSRDAVVVAGSNGKGSTAALCAGIGRACGLRTGLFTSPHLYRFNERFQIDGVSIEDDVLTPLILRVATAIVDLGRRGIHEKFGAFEAQFALACLYFQESDCRFAVFEAGIGGRYDPVRLVGASVSCVTSVDYEHVNLLGNALALIASDKSDACAAGGTVVYGENCRPLQQHLAEYNRSRKVAGLYVRDEIEIENEAAASPLQQFDLRFGDHHFLDLQIGLLGDFQFNNAAIAVALFLLWGERTGLTARPAAVEAAIRTGLARTSWPGRLEKISTDPLTVIDVGHTPDGVVQALRSLKAVYGQDDWIVVLGVSSDKNIEGIVGQIAPDFDTVICTAAHHKGADARLIGAAVRKCNPGARIHIASRIEDAVRIGRQLTKLSRQKIYVAGGLFVAVEYATVLRGGNAKELQFF
jgi:dihydrofolate synthase/folylpolyglutamate synthase